MLLLKSKNKNVIYMEYFSYGHRFIGDNLYVHFLKLKSLIKFEDK